MTFSFALPNVDCRNHMISEMLALLFNTKNLIYFSWVKSQAGVAGDELADSLTKDAAKMNLLYHSQLLSQPLI